MGNKNDTLRLTDAQKKEQKAAEAILKTEANYAKIVEFQELQQIKLDMALTKAREACAKHAETKVLAIEGARQKIEKAKLKHEHLLVNTEHARIRAAVYEERVKERNAAQGVANAAAETRRKEEEAKKAEAADKAAEDSVDHKVKEAEAKAAAAEAKAKEAEAKMAEVKMRESQSKAPASSSFKSRSPRGSGRASNRS